MIVRKIADIPRSNKVRGLVPTMGALHAGHQSLIRKARQECEDVAVSVFVNPTQFGPNEDYSRYPRQLEQDAEMAYQAGADWIFAPEPSEMYPDSQTTVHVGGVTEDFEGSRRPGHFDGVATVVIKLINIVRPDRAYFGLKDLQQCQVIRKMVDDLNVPVQLEFCETVRESDGLALSSRNAYLTPEERRTAPAIYRELSRIKTAVQQEQSALCLDPQLQISQDRLSDLGFDVDYLDVIDLRSMRRSRALGGSLAVIIAARLGKTRLIDNVLLGD